MYYFVQYAKFINNLFSLSIPPSNEKGKTHKRAGIISSYQNSDIKSSTYTKVKDKNLTVCKLSYSV